MLIIVALLLIANISYLFIIPSVLIAGLLVLANSFLGRRCPHCRGRLKQGEGRLHPGDQRVVQVVWRCSVDDYEEIESSRYDPAAGS